MARKRLLQAATGRRERREYAALFSALGDPIRLQLLERLGAGNPLSIATLTSGTSVTRQAISKHLRTLADVGLACSALRGRERLWSPLPARLHDAQRHMARISAHWDHAPERLRRQVEAR